MTAPSVEEPLQKITLNLFEKDYQQMKVIYGDGYSVKIRALVRQHLREWKRKAMEAS